MKQLPTGTKPTIAFLLWDPFSENTRLNNRCLPALDRSSIEAIMFWVFLILRSISYNSLKTSDKK